MSAKMKVSAKFSLRWLLHLIFGFGLIACLVWLILAHYHSHVALQEGLIKDYQHEVDRHAIAINQFYQERRDDVFDVAESQVITSFFANKALGMSMQYGLRASLVHVEEYFNFIVSTKKISGKPIYESIVMLDNASEILAASQGSEVHKAKNDFKVNLAQINKKKPSVILSNWPEQRSVLVAMPILFKEVLSGFVLAKINYCVLLDEDIFPPRGKYHNNKVLLGKTADGIVPLCHTDKSAIASNKQIIQSLDEKTTKHPVTRMHSEKNIVRTVPIKGTPLILFAAAPKTQIRGSQGAEYILYFMIAILSILLSGLAFLVRVEVKSSKLRLELAKNEKAKRQELEFLNAELDDQIAERRRAEEATKQKNELLYSLNEILLVTLQTSAIEDVAQNCLSVIAKLIDCKVGFIGVFSASGVFKMLASLDGANQRCELEQKNIPMLFDHMFKQGMLGELVSSTNTLLANESDFEALKIGFPDGHIGLNSILSVPLWRNNQCIGVIALANKKSGFTSLDATNLEELSASFITALVQKQTDEALRISEERNRTLVDSITEGLIMVDENACITYLNANMLDMLEIELEDAKGRPVFDFMDEKNQEIVRKNFEYRKVGNEDPYEMAWNIPDGSKKVTMIYPKVFLGDDGEFHGSLALVIDLSVRKARDAQILQTQKLEAIGQLAAGIAHEINTPTNYVANNVTFIKDSFDSLTKMLAECASLRTAIEDDQPTQLFLDSMRKIHEEANLDYILEEIPPAIDETLEGLDHIAKIVRSMKEFAHPGLDSKTKVDLNECIQNTINVAKNEWKYVADVELNLDPDLPMTYCVPSQINQVLLNLIVNAAQAIADAEKGNGLIKISSRQLNDKIEIKIIDNGSGIPEQLQQRIFEPFFTTKEPGKGTGQGLAIAHSVIVENHAGSISLQSDGSTGSEFIIGLPLISEEVET